MKNAYLLLIISTMMFTGCASNIHLSSSSNGAINDHKWFDSENEDIRFAAQIVKIGYADIPSDAISEFKKIGFDATYISPARYFRNYPEAFILSTPESNTLVVLFVGTDSGGDWLENIKAFNYQDNPRLSRAYIMPGHGGFRRGMLNLLDVEFFEKQLSSHVEKYDVKLNSSKTKVVVTGHSQGAGLSQLSLPIIDGYEIDNGVVKQNSDWPFKVVKEIRFASPYAVSIWKTGAAVNGCTEREDSAPYFDQWSLIHEKYDQISVNVIREDDMVPTLWNPACGHKTTAKHYGKFIRIDRDGKARRVDTNWENNRPHHIDTYINGLKNDF